MYSLIPKNQPVKIKEYKTLVPVDVGTEPDLVCWLAAESIHRTANAHSMYVVDYRQEQLDVDQARAVMLAEGNRPDHVEQALGKTLDQFDWWLFEATAQVDVNFMNYLTAEGQWRNRQIVEWLQAEKVWQGTNA